MMENMIDERVFQEDRFSSLFSLQNERTLQNLQIMSNATQEGRIQQPSHGASSTEGNVEEPAPVSKKKRNQPGHPDPDAEVVALSPGTLMATNRYMCEVCHKGFQRDQNLQLHRRGHNLPWKLKQRTAGLVKKKVYICPEVGCPHHDPSRALGDLTGIKKHYCRKHGEKKWKCDKCSKRYAVQSDWKAHAKICGTREYRCDCGTIFSRRDSFITHRAFCDALAEENYKVQQGIGSMGGPLQAPPQELFQSSLPASLSSSNSSAVMNLAVSNQDISPHPTFPFTNSSGVMFSNGSDQLLDQHTSMAPKLQHNGNNSTCLSSGSGTKIPHLEMGPAYMSATALLQKAAEMGAMVSDSSISPALLKGFAGYSASGRTCGEPSNDPLDISPQLVPATNAAYMGHPNAFGKGVLHQTSVLHGGGFLDSQALMQYENRNEDYVPGGDFMAGLQKDYYGGNDRMPVDFLSLGPVEHLGIGDVDRDDRRNELRYVADQQNLRNILSDHHNAHGHSVVEKQMWNF